MPSWAQVPRTVGKLVRVPVQQMFDGMICRTFPMMCRNIYCWVAKGAMQEGLPSGSLDLIILIVDEGDHCNLACKVC